MSDILILPAIAIIVLIIIQLKRKKIKPHPKALKTWDMITQMYNEQQPKLYTTSLVGWNYEGRDKYLTKMIAGDPLIFIPVKDNKHDPFAVGCYNLAGNQIGWLKRDTGGIASVGEELHANKIEIYGTLAGFKNHWPYIEIGILRK